MGWEAALDFALLALAAVLAGVVDAVIGGGGMVQLPALFLVFPSAVPAALFGTNKLSAAVGTTGAAIQYARAAEVPWGLVVPTAIVAFFASVLGALAIMALPVEPLRQALPFILLVLLVYTVSARRDQAMELQHHRYRRVSITTLGSTAIGFYDGFFGAGTGAFYKSLFVRGIGMDFLRAAAPAKIVNVASNLGAVAVFASAGHMFWWLAFGMAVANYAGGQFGSRIALRFGNDFIRRAFIVVVSLLIAKTFHDAYLR